MNLTCSRCGAPGIPNSGLTPTRTPQTDGQGNTINAMARDRDGDPLLGLEVICSVSKKVEWLCPRGPQK